MASSRLPSVQARLDDGKSETPKPGDPAFARSETRIIAAPQASLEAAAEVANRAGYRPLILGDAIEGEASEVGKVMAGIARQVAVHGQPAPLSMRPDLRRRDDGDGRGSGQGRKERRIPAVASGRTRWPASNLRDSRRHRRRGWGRGGRRRDRDPRQPRTRESASDLNARALLADNDAHGFFRALGDQVVTGPTLTNVNDFRAVLINA